MTALAWNGEIYAQGTISRRMAVTSSGNVSGKLVLSAVAGANMQQYNPLRRQWVTYYEAQFPLGNQSHTATASTLSRCCKTG